MAGAPKAKYKSLIILLACGLFYNKIENCRGHIEVVSHAQGPT